MDTLPLPPHPSLEQYKKRAKDLVKAANSPDHGGGARVGQRLARECSRRCSA